MTEEAIQWAVPAITLGYAVVNDPNGKFKFYTDDVEIVYRCGTWVAIDGVDPDRVYPDLRTALEQEA